MAIQHKPKPASIAQDAFISRARDAAQQPQEAPREYDKGIAKGNKRQITLTIAPEILRRVDEVAHRTGQARAAVINMAIYRALEGDLFK